MKLIMFPLFEIFAQGTKWSFAVYSSLPHSEEVSRIAACGKAPLTLFLLFFPFLYFSLLFHYSYRHYTAM